MTTEEKIKNIISTLLEWGLMDYEKARADNEYLIQCIESYIEAKNIVDNWLK